MSPRDATVRAMKEVSSPVVAIALVLSAVFIPMAFIGGIQGRAQHAVRGHHRHLGGHLRVQRALPVAGAVGHAAAPAQAVARSAGAGVRPVQPVAGVGDARLRPGQPRPHPQGCARRRHPARLHRGRRSDGQAAAGQLPPGGGPGLHAGQHERWPRRRRSSEPTPPRARWRRSWPAPRASQNFNAIIGFSLLTRVTATYNAFFFVQLDSWDERGSPELQAKALSDAINRRLATEVPEANAFAFLPPSIPGLGTSGGFSLWLQDRSGGRVDFLDQNLQKFLAAARKRPELTGLNSGFTAAVPQVFADVDRDKALVLGVDIREVYQTLQANLGGIFVNQFNRFGRQWRVFLGSEGQYRLNEHEHRPVLRPQLERRHGAAVGPDHDPPHLRAGVHQPLQPVPRRAGDRGRRARLQLRAGDGRARGGGGRDPAAGDRLRLGRSLLPGAGRRRAAPSSCSRFRSCSCS